MTSNYRDPLPLLESFMSEDEKKTILASAANAIVKHRNSNGGAPVTCDGFGSLLADVQNIASKFYEAKKDR
jgi:hypothetical protein